MWLLLAFYTSWFNEILVMLHVMVLVFTFWLSLLITWVHGIFYSLAQWFFVTLPWSTGFNKIKLMFLTLVCFCFLLKVMYCSEDMFLRSSHLDSRVNGITIWWFQHFNLDWFLWLFNLTSLYLKMFNTRRLELSS
jgi:hypothetical protein